MYDSTTQNPELIWNNETRQIVAECLGKTLNELAQSQLIDPTKKWDSKLFKESCSYQTIIGQEYQIGGVYLQIFINSPSWTVRHPKEFATELMEALLELMGNKLIEGNAKQQENLEQVTKALVLLFTHHPTTADQVKILIKIKI